MKISKYGSRQFHTGGKGTSERSAKFRKRYRVGEILKGILVKWEYERLGWVDIGDLRLLANIQTSPSPGDELIFTVQQLYPDIVLKELTPDQLNANGEYISPADATKNFVSNRAAFQSYASVILSELCRISNISASERRNYFFKQLENDTKASILFFKTLKCAANLNSVFETTKLYYMPWLIPQALNQEIVLRIKDSGLSQDDPFYEILFAFDMPPSIPVRLRLMYKKPNCGFKIMVDDPGSAAILKDIFKNRFDEFIGIEKIPHITREDFLLNF